MRRILLVLTAAALMMAMMMASAMPAFAKASPPKGNPPKACEIGQNTALYAGKKDFLNQLKHGTNVIECVYDDPPGGDYDLNFP